MFLTGISALLLTLQNLYVSCILWFHSSGFDVTIGSMVMGTNVLCWIVIAVESSKHAGWKMIFFYVLASC